LSFFKNGNLRTRKYFWNIAEKFNFLLELHLSPTNVVIS